MCSNCGYELFSLGEECIRSEVVHIPARLEVIDYYRQSFECRHCRKEGRRTIVKPVMPQPVIPHSIASASVVAHSMIQKYLYAMPLYRQEQEWRQLGLSVSRANVSNWILLTAQEWLYPLLDRMHEELLYEPCIHADETPIQVMQEAGRKNTTKSYMWLYTSGPFEAHRTIRIFEYQPTRNGDHAKTFLNGFHGYLLTDAFAGYEKVDRITHCLCWSHARRKFVDAKPADMTDITGTLVKEGIERISHLFHLESDYAACSAAERKQKRLDEEKPCLEALLAWAETNKEKVLPKSPLSKALYYLISNWDGLTRYWEDGRCSLSNNIAENSIRPFTVGRKNWLFSGSPKGAKASVLQCTASSKPVKPTSSIRKTTCCTCSNICRMKRNFRIETYWIGTCHGIWRSERLVKNK
nr:IS66 family transposase [Megasphaera cerevisiae]